MQVKNSKNSSSNQTLAIPFITVVEGKGFELSREAQQFLTALPEERQLGIVSIVGKYRTGKSFFVNRVLLDQKKGGFQVGPTINPCTKGLWLWKKTIQSQSNEDMDVILIDTEGFGGMDQNANHDSRIFLFSLLLSSYFIYNSVGSIDQNAINTLNLIINLAKDIQSKSNNSDDDSQFPAFLWIIRDFTLKLVDKEQSNITPKQYLQNALKQVRGNSDAIANKNKIRRLLKLFFQDRDCSTMVRPTEAQKDLQRLDQMDNSMLRPEFVSQVNAIRNKVYSSVKPKRVNGKALNGNLLVTLIKGYMETINKGHLPNVESAWFYVCRSEGLKAVNVATRKLQEQVDNLLKNPLKESQMAAAKEQIRKKVMQQFKKKAMNSEEGHPDLVEKLQRRIDEQFSDFNKKNCEKWTEIYRQVAQDKIQKLREKIFNEQYNSFNDFIKQYEQVKAQFDRQTTEGDSSQKWRHFNELSENLYRLAGETVTEKLNSTYKQQNSQLKQKLSMQEQEKRQITEEIISEKQRIKQKSNELEQENIRLRAFQQSTNVRLTQHKNQFEKLYEKHQQMQTELEQTRHELAKAKKTQQKMSEAQSSNIKSEILTIKSTMQKEKALFEMEKQYLQQQADRYKDRCQQLQADNRKIRTQNTKITSDFEDLQSSYEQKEQELQLMSESNNSLAKKVQQLLQENSKKNQLVGDHNEWLLEKSYLENQVAFLKNSMTENKRLHDALLVAFQNAVVDGEGAEGQNLAQLLDANKQMSAMLEKLGEKYRQLQDKYQKLKELKKVVKSCSAMECSACRQIVPAKMFAQHVNGCSGQNETSSISSKQNRNVYQNKENPVSLQITVSQLVEQSKKNQHSSYLVSLNYSHSPHSKWTVSKRYKDFKEMHENLLHQFPSIKYPESCNFLADFNSLINNSRRNMMADERKKSIQQYLRDLYRIPEIRESHIFRSFLSLDEGRSSEDTEESKPVTKKSSNFAKNSQTNKKSSLSVKNAY